jgi:hypothetical protein
MTMSATTLHEVSREWVRSHSAAIKARFEEIEATHRDALDRMEKFYQARRAAGAHGMPKGRTIREVTRRGDAMPPASQGPGWRVLDRPTVPHEQLARRAKEIWDQAFHGAPFPPGWTLWWGRLEGDGVCGLTVYADRRIIVDEQKMRTRPDRDLDALILHEVSHVLHKDEVLSEKKIHGPKFRRTLDSMLAFVTARADGLAAVAQPGLDRPTPHPARTEDLMNAKPTKMTPEAWFQGAVAWQALVDRKLEAERREHGELDATPLATRLHAKRRAQLAQERADVERREQEAIEAYAAASEDAIAFMRMYCAGRARPRHVSLAEAEGAQLALMWPTGPSLTAQCARRARLGR